MSDFTSEGHSAGIVTRETCDASAVPSEYAANVVTLPNGQTLTLCGHHTHKHGPALLMAGAMVTPIPNVYADATEDAPNDGHNGESELANV